MILIALVSFKKVVSLIVSGTVKKKLKDVHAHIFRISHFIFLIIYIYHVLVYFLIVKSNRDIVLNPGPKPNSCKNF